MSGLTVLAVDDELPALDELTYLLGQCPPVGRVASARSANEALVQLDACRFDLVLLDIRMPGVDGLTFASMLGRHDDPPEVVFVTAYQEHALAAFDVGASGYLLKPIERTRLLQLLERIAAKRLPVPDEHDPLDVVLVERVGRTLLLGRSQIAFVESAGDYVRLHTHDGAAYLVRLSISTLEDRWIDHGFARIHRSYLVALRSIKEIWTEETHTTVRVVDHELRVSRRHLHELRERLVGEPKRSTP